MLQAINSGLADIRAGLTMRRVWVALASEDIGDQHRRTALGPFWLLMNYLAFAGTFLVIFANSHTMANFPAYVAIGLFVWLYISDVITQSVSLFVRRRASSRVRPCPLRSMSCAATQSSIRAGYAFAGCLAILILGGTPVTVGWLLVCSRADFLLLGTTPAVITVCAFGGPFFPICSSSCKTSCGSVCS